MKEGGKTKGNVKRKGISWEKKSLGRGYKKNAKKRGGKIGLTTESEHLRGGGLNQVRRGKHESCKKLISSYQTAQRLR